MATEIPDNFPPKNPDSTIAALASRLARLDSDHFELCSRYKEDLVYFLERMDDLEKRMDNFAGFFAELVRLMGKANSAQRTLPPNNAAPKTKMRGNCKIIQFHRIA